MVNQPDGGQFITEYHDNEVPPYVITKTKENAAPGTFITKYVYYDGLGRPIQTVSFGENQTPIVTLTYYDEMGRIYLVVGPFFASSEGFYTPYLLPPSASDCPWVITEYDARGRVDKITTYDNQLGTLVTNYKYDGLSTAVTDPDNKKKTQLKDFLGRLRQVTEYTKTDEGVEVHHNTTYTYNAAGDLLTVTDALGNLTDIRYDTLGRKKNINDPDMGFWQYEYDANGNLSSQTDARGQQITFHYDELNRITGKIYSPLPPENGVAPTNNVTYTYDEPSTINGKGRLCSVSNGDVTTKITAYDAMGRTRAVNKTLGIGPNNTPTTYTTQYSYDLSGKLKTTVYPVDNYSVEYHYYPGSGLLESVWGGGSLKFAGYSGYSATGRIGTVTYGNDAETNYKYDPLSTRLTSLTTWHPAAGDIQNKEYGYSKAGDITSITNNLTNVTYNYQYDDLHRLESEEETGAGEPTTPAFSVVNSYSPPTTPVHAVKTATVNDAAYEYAYDANGNMTRGYDFSDPADIATRAITYNADNLPTEIEHSRYGHTSYVYDGDGVRVKKITEMGGGAGYTHYIGPHYEVQDDSATRYIFAGSTRIAMMTDEDFGGPFSPHNFHTFYFHADHLGSSTVLTSAEAISGIEDNAESIDYLPYGGERSHAGTRLADYTYTGQERDAESGLYNYGARLYDPMTAMFISADSMVPNYADPQSLNRYSYCLNNPLIYTDPTGNYWASVEGGYAEFDGPPTPWALESGFEDKLNDLYYGSTQSVIASEEFSGSGGPAFLPSSLADNVLYGSAQSSAAMEENFDMTQSVMFDTLSPEKQMPYLNAKYQEWAIDAGFAAVTGGAGDLELMGLIKAAKSGAADEIFHYTFSRFVSSIEKQGLRAGSYATPTGTLSPLQAQIDLALAPNRGLRDALIRVDLAGLRQAGYEIPQVTQVGRSFGMPGGGFEMQFPYSIPPQFLKVIQP